MYELWKDGYIAKPSEFWNMSHGDKLVLKVFHDYQIEEKNKQRKELKRTDAPIFPVTIV